MENLKLFDVEETEKAQQLNNPTCRTCDNRERHQCGSKVIQYCGVRKSNRTLNGLLKIKVTMPACYAYKPM